MYLNKSGKVSKFVTIRIQDVWVSETIFEVLILMHLRVSSFVG